MRNRIWRNVTTGLVCAAAGLAVGFRLGGHRESGTPDSLPARGVEAEMAQTNGDTRIDRPGETGHADSHESQEPDAPEIAGERSLSIPVDALNDLIRMPLGVDLIPPDHILKAIGLTPQQSGFVQLNFGAFREFLEAKEAELAELKSDENGSWFGIPPIDTAKASGRLRGRLESLLGASDWRAAFLMAALEKSPFTAGMGKYRQEVALEEVNTPDGGVYQAVRARYFNQGGLEVSGSGHQVRDESGFSRYRRLFLDRADTR